MFNNGTLIVYIEYDVSSISKWSWHPTLETLAVRDSFSLLVTYGCISIKTICGYNLETHVSLVITKFNVSWAKFDQNICEGFMTILPYVWFWIGIVCMTEFVCLRLLSFSASKHRHITNTKYMFVYSHSITIPLFYL